MPNKPPDLKHLIRLGAKVRLQALDVERAAILRAFPGIATKRRGTIAASSAPQRDGNSPAGAPKRRKMSAEGRAAIIAATKKRWAEWRQKKKA